MRRTDLLGSLAGGRTEHRSITTAGRVSGIEGLCRLPGRERAGLPREIAQDLGGHPRLAHVGTRSDDDDQPAGPHPGQRATGAGMTDAMADGPVDG